MVNVGNLRKRNSTGSTVASTAEKNNILKIVEEISNKRSLTIPAEFTRQEIPNFFADSENDGLKMDSFGLSLIDPISKLRIRIPVRSVECDHFQCFDLHNFLEFSLQNARDANNKSTWRCPHCQAEASQNQLRVDEYFQEILLKVGPGPLEVELLPDGNWREVEQLDFKEVLLNSIDEGEIVEIFPKKRAKIFGSKIEENARSSDNSQSLLDKDLREILGIAPGEDLLEAVRKLKQRAEAWEKSALANSREIACQTLISLKCRENLTAHKMDPEICRKKGLCWTSIPETSEDSNRIGETSFPIPNPISTKMPEEQAKENNCPLLNPLEAGKSSQAELIKGGVLEKIKRFWVEIRWEGKPPEGSESPFCRGQKKPASEFRLLLKERANVDCYGGMAHLYGDYVRVALRSREDAEAVIESFNGTTHFGCKLQLKLLPMDEIVVSIPITKSQQPPPKANNSNKIKRNGGAGNGGKRCRQNESCFFHPPDQRQQLQGSSVFSCPFPQAFPPSTAPLLMVVDPIGSTFQQHFPPPPPGIPFSQSFSRDGFFYR